MNKISLSVAVLVSSLGLSGMALAGNETATPANGRPMVSPVANVQVQKSTPEVDKGTMVANAKSTVAQKATPEAGNSTAVVADAKSKSDQKAGQDAKQQKPEATAKVDTKSVTPAPVATQDGNTKK